MTSFDYGIIAVYFAFVLWVGWRYGRRNRSMDDFLLGGRKMKSLPVALSLFVSWFSIISYTAIPGELIANGPMIWTGLLAAPIGLWFVGWRVIPRLRRMWRIETEEYDTTGRRGWRTRHFWVSSAYEILEIQFGQSTARLASTLFLLMRIAWMAMITHIASTVIVAPIFLPRTSGASVAIALMIIGVTVAYSLGGFRAVVLTDCIQAGIMFGGAIAIIFIVGEGVVWNAGELLERDVVVAWPVPKLCDPWARVSIIPAMVGAVSLGTCVKCGDQMNVQRFLSVPSVRASRQVLLAGFGFDLALTSLLALVGLCLLTQSSVAPDGDQVLPHLVASGLPIGISGLIVAALLAAAMSSISSGLNACVSTIASDWWTDGRADFKLIEAPIVTVCLGVSVFGLSQFFGFVEGNLFELCYKIVNLLATPLGGLVLTALFIPRARVRMVWLGCFACLGVVVWVTYFSDVTFLLASPLGLATQLTICFFGRTRNG